MISRPSKTILLVEDTESTRVSLARLLGLEGYKVVTAGTRRDAVRLISNREVDPGFVILDQVIDQDLAGGTRAAVEISKILPNILIIMYTAVPTITEDQRRGAMAAGAHRYIRKGGADELINDFRDFIRDMTELTELSNRMKKITEGRLSMVTALVGVDVYLSIVDKEYRIWFSNDPRFPDETAAEFRTYPCWTVYHKRPPEWGPCVGCTAEQSIKTGQSLSCVALRPGPSGELEWAEMATTPIFAEDSEGSKKVIATRQTRQLLGANADKLGFRDRCRAITDGILQLGFGRVRLYQAVDSNRVKCIRAAACRPETDKARFQEDALDFEVSAENNPYMRKAIEEHDGTLNIEWNPNLGPDVAAKVKFDLRPPWIDLPVWEGKNLSGWIAVDIVGGKLDALSNEILKRLRPYSAEFGKALAQVGIVRERDLPKRAVLEEARRAIANAPNASAALQAIVNSIFHLVSEYSRCDDVWVRRWEDENLVLQFRLHEEGRILEPSISLENRDSLAAYVIRFENPLFIQSAEEYGRRVTEDRDLPPGLAPGVKGALAILPLKIEGLCFGTVGIECVESLNWETSGLRVPLLELSRLLALLVRDTVVNRAFSAEKVAVERERDLAFRAIHGVKGPVQAIRNSLQLIREMQENGSLQGKDAADLAALAGLAVERVERLAGRLMRLRREGPGKIERIELRRHLEEWCASCSASHPDLSIEWSVENDVPAVNANPEDLRTSLEELVTNSAKAAARHVWIRVAHNNATVNFELQDDGVGVNAENLLKIFELWHSDFPEGDGLGLWFIKRVIEDLGGQITASSADRGLTINIEIPAEE